MNAKIIKSPVREFNTYKSAYWFASRTLKPHYVLMGDNGMYWVASSGFTARLEKLGYEIAEFN